MSDKNSNLETISAIFQEAGTPFSINMPKFKSIDNIMHSPEFTELTNQFPHLLIVTDSDIAHIIEKTGEPDYIDTIDHFKTNRMHVERYEYTQSFFGSLMSIIKEDNPPLHKFLDAYTDREATEHFEISTELAESHGIKATPHTQFRALSGISFLQNRLVNGYSVTPLVPLEYNPDLQVLKIPDESFNKNDCFERTSSIIKDMTVNTPPPGTNTEWVALLTAHETAHLFDGIRVPQHQYFNTIQSQNDIIDFTQNDHIYARHANETDQDLNAYYAVGHIVSDEVFSYWAAHRIASQSMKHIDVAYKDQNNAQIITPTSGHDSGFLLLDYMKNGELPNYFDITRNTNEFYTKTALFINEEYGFNNNKKPTSPEFLYAVEQALQQEKSIYNAGERSIAENYVNALKNTLGVPPKEIIANKELNIITTQTTPENTPTAAPKGN